MIETGDTVWKQVSRALPQRLTRREKDVLLLAVTALAALGVLILLDAFGTAPALSVLGPLLVATVISVRPLWRVWKFRSWDRDRAAVPSAPWEWDVPWDGGPIALREPRGDFEVTTEGGGVTVTAMILVCVWMNVSFWDRFGPQGRSVVGAFTLGVAAYGIYATMRLRDVRAARVAFSSFPVRLGSPFEVRFGPDDESGHFDALRFVFRCLEERGRGWRGARCEVVFQTVIEIEPGRIPEPGADVTQPVELPSDAPGTDFTGRRACYWEFVIEGAGSLGAFQRTFLAPVYAT